MASASLSEPSVTSAFTCKQNFVHFYHLEYWPAPQISIDDQPNVGSNQKL